MGANAPVVVNRDRLTLVVLPLVLNPVLELGRGETDLSVRSIAERLVGRSSATAKCHRRLGCDRALSVTEILEVLHQIGPIGRGGDARFQSFL